MPAHFTKEQQEEIRIRLFEAGIALSKTVGLRKMTVSKLTSECSIAKGSFYNFYESKEAFILALFEYTSSKIQEMLLKKLNGRSQMTVHEFFELFREYLDSGYDIMTNGTVEDYFWIKENMSSDINFNSDSTKETLAYFFRFISDLREDYDTGVVINLVKAVYALKEHRETMCVESLDKSIDMIFSMLEDYLVKK